MEKHSFTQSQIKKNPVLSNVLVDVENPDYDSVSKRYSIHVEINGILEFAELFLNASQNRVYNS